ncbi:Multiple inositol polyphosphate phosphatase 1 [Sesamum angolense]|uniref:Multiple inositol polyphosphate phosphatase 1 n=1 Tax=Sesamum angolense TaxID=2727404 RepID=A0AAE1W222_9LAMI|nr:Multiple inositol polyphosphate phosphatase 1 [Sesamum angolense]
MAATPAIVLFLLLLFPAAVFSNAEDSFDVRRHLSTATRYHIAKDISENSIVPSNIPTSKPENTWCFVDASWKTKQMFYSAFVKKSCDVLDSHVKRHHQARHGTRAPTKKKLKELEALVTRLKVLLENVKEQKSTGIPTWLWGWKSPWTGKHKGGELVSEGKNELYELGIRTREKFPDLFNEDYHPDIYPIKATQVSRASASAVAFGMGLFSDRGNLGPGRHRAFAVTSESRASDIMLRFHDCCQNYKEASLLNKTDQACALFTPSEVGLLEWADDLEVFVLKGYGNSLNYRMGVPLLEDVIQSMEQAINAKEDGLVSGSYEMARLRFAHAETLLPFSCLIGLFLDGPEFERILSEQPLELPVKPPQKRIWHGSSVAPFAGNNMLVLYSCPASNSSRYFVQALHNERPTPLAGCGNSDFCPFEVFKERIAAPHLKHDYNALCSMELEQSKQTAPTNKFSQILSWFFPGDSKQPQNAEL